MLQPLLSHSSINGFSCFPRELWGPDLPGLSSLQLSGVTARGAGLRGDSHPPPPWPGPHKVPCSAQTRRSLFSALNPEPGRVTPMSLQGSGQQGLVVAEEPGHLLPCCRCGREWRRRRKRRVRAPCRKEGAADRLCRFGGEILGGAGGCWVPRASRAPATSLHGAAPVPANSGGPWQGPDAAVPRAGAAMPLHGDGPRGHSCWGLNRN